MPLSNDPPTDEELADELDVLARQATRLRHLLPHVTRQQLHRVAEAIPFPSDVEDTLLDLDTWAVCAAASLRETIVDLAG